MGKFQLDRL